MALFLTFCVTPSSFPITTVLQISVTLSRSHFGFLHTESLSGGEQGLTDPLSLQPTYSLKTQLGHRRWILHFLSGRDIAFC